MGALGGPETRYIGLAVGYLYAALIFSFLGGSWWGIAVATRGAPDWIYGAAVMPSLIALATGIPWANGGTWPGPSLIILGLCLLASPLVDRRIATISAFPHGWFTLRIGLSLVLGTLTIVLGMVA